MKIVQIMATDGGEIGGLEKHTFQLCAKLAETQEVHLFLDKDYAGKIPEKNHIYCHYFNFSKGRTNLGLLYCIFKSIKKFSRTSCMHKEERLQNFGLHTHFLEDSKCCYHSWHEK